MSDVSLDWLDYGKIVEIVEIASQIILQIYLNDELFMNMNMTIENKVEAGNSPLTIADKKANDFICRELRGLYPDIPIISEENKNDDWEVRRKYTWVWLVDPLDGTKEFIKRNGEFTVNIGLVYGGQPMVGFVGVPAQGVVYWGGVGVGGEGAGAWKREISGGKTIDLLEVIRLRKKGKITRIVASRSHMDDKTEQFIKDNYVEKGMEVDLLNVGSSMKILWIAENKADVYPRLVPTMEWDTCAAHAILRACGGALEIVEVPVPDSYESSHNAGTSGVINACASSPNAGTSSEINACAFQHDASGLGVCPFLKGAGAGAGAAELSYNKSNLLNPYFIGKLRILAE
jgi:3'(2'), 5'-bisphosphate nucleotidase